MHEDIEFDYEENYDTEENETLVEMEGSTNFSCQSCTFQSKSQRGIDVHIGRKHKDRRSSKITCCVSHRPIVGRGG